MTTFEELFAVKLPIDPVSRESMLRDNANAMEKGFGYTKRFTNEELELKRASLEELSIKLHDLEEKKKEFNADHKAEVEPIKTSHSKIISELKNKSEYILDDCYLYLEEERMIMHYVTRSGEVVYSRPARTNERQKTIYSIGNAVGE